MEWKEIKESNSLMGNKLLQNFLQVNLQEKEIR